MRITIIIILAACLQTSAHGYAQRVTLKEKDAPLDRLFLRIEAQTGYAFAYTGSQLSQARPVTVDLSDATLDEALAACFRGQPFTYAIVGNTIVVKPFPAPEPGPSSPPADIHGRVTDSTGVPLAGANIMIKGIGKGTSTDADGKFELKGVAGNAILIISFTGYESREIRLNGRTEISITLRREVTTLQDIVINKGYYQVKQRLSTGTVSVVTAKEIGQQPVTDPILALVGRVPGLSIAQTSGMPGAYSTIHLRGVNSIPNPNALLTTVNDPLYIIDGVPFGSASLTSRNIGGGALGSPGGNGANVLNITSGISPFNSIDPSTIESIEILKDADATAIYGSRGANGVILITTKRGKAGTTKVDIDVNQGVGQVTRKIPLMNTRQYLAMRREAFKNDGKTPGLTDYDINGAWDTTRYTDWQKILIGNTAQYTNVHVNVSGGNANTQFLLSGGYTRQGTVFPGNYEDKKGMFTVNIDHTATNQKFHAAFTANYTHENNILPFGDFTNSITLAPDAPALYDASGNLNWQVVNGTTTFYNPLASIYAKAGSIVNMLTSKLNLGYKILPGLELTANGGYTRSQLDQSQLSPATLTYNPPYNVPANSRTRYGTSGVETWIIEPQLNYHKQLGKGKLEMLVGSTFQESVNKSIGYFTFNYTSDALLSNPLSAASVGLAGNEYALYRYNAVFGRIGYNWEDKYLLNITARRDGSSRFGPGKQWGNFGAVGAGWIFSKEKAVADHLSFLSFGKLRGSYGVTGSDGLQDYYYLSVYTPNSSTVQGITTLNPTRFNNPNFSWPQTKKLEGGLDLGFIRDRINLSVAYYQNRTTNQLIGYPLSVITGFSSVQYNFPALVQNSGWELELHTVNIHGKDFSWNTSVNISFQKNKLVSFPGLEKTNFMYLYTIGQSMFAQKGFHALGVNPQTGFYAVSTNNVNGNPTVVDFIRLPDRSPQYFGGFQNTFSYKGLSLDFLFQFVKQIAPIFKTEWGLPGSYNRNQPVWVMNRWQSPGQITDEAKYTVTGANSGYGNVMGSDGVIKNAFFIRLKNVSLSYQLPAAWQQSIHVTNARIYMQAQNLLSISQFQGLDPETYGLNLPPLRMITLGINASF